MESIVCVCNTPTAEKMCQLRKEKFDGRIGEGLVLLDQLCIEDETVLNNLDNEISALDRQIEKENQLIGNIHKIRQQQKELVENQELLEQLTPKIQQAKERYRAAEQAAAECGQLALEMKEQQKNLVLFDKLEQAEKALVATKITELLGIEYPIIQGGMAWVADYHLAAAVSEAGGLGIIGAVQKP